MKDEILPLKRMRKYSTATLIILFIVATQLWTLFVTIRMTLSEPSEWHDLYLLFTSGFGIFILGAIPFIAILVCGFELHCRYKLMDKYYKDILNFEESLREDLKR